MVANGGAEKKKLKYDSVFKQMQLERYNHAKLQEHDYSHVFSDKSRLDLIRLSFIIIGIEFAYSAETAFASPILLEIGLDHKQMAMAWVFSPLLGFFMSPLMGSVSDKCKLAIGRRRPFILLMSIGIFIGIALIPYGQSVGEWFGDAGDIIVSNTTEFENILNTTDYTTYTINDNGYHIKSFRYAIIITILGTILLDINADACQIFARSYLLDICLPDDQPKALSTYSIMAGIGAFLGYVLTAINWKALYIGEYLGGTIKTVFIIVMFIFIFSVVWTVTSFREIPLTLIDKDNLLKPITHAAVKQERLKLGLKAPKVQEEVEEEEITKSIEKKEQIVEVKVLVDSEVDEIVDEEENTKLTLKDYLRSIIAMPKSMRILCITNLLCWMSHLCYCLYFTTFVGEAVFNGDPYAPRDSEEYQLFEDGVSFGCWGMALYSLTCSIYVFAIEKLIKIMNAKIVYVGSLLIDSVGMMILAIYPTKLNVIIFSAICGILLAILFTMPYFLVAQYHSENCFSKSKKNQVVTDKPPTQAKRGLGTDIAVVGGMIFVAQIIVALTIGPFISLIGSTTAIVYADSILSFLGAISATQIVYI